MVGNIPFPYTTKFIKISLLDNILNYLCCHGNHSNQVHFWMPHLLTTPNQPF
uniref:Uncharacterized protein n=1 Tax=Amphimedon queenslandica TaxID=400682 RepID=A0A1X7UA72_AMPQE